MHLDAVCFVAFAGMKRQSSLCIVFVQYLTECSTMRAELCILDRVNSSMASCPRSTLFFFQFSFCFRNSKNGFLLHTMM